MYHLFQIFKKAGTYADTLEAYGFAHLVRAIYDNQNISESIRINDKGIYYEVVLNEPITENTLDRINYFQILEFLKKDDQTELPSNFGKKNYFNYPEQRSLKKQRKAEYDKIADLKGDNYKKAKRRIEEKYSTEGKQRIRDDYDVFAQLISNPYAAFLKLHGNFENNQLYFKTLISEIFNHYLPANKQISTDYKTLLKSKKISVEEKATMLQLINPNQGKGLNKAKATGMSVGNLKGNWIQETMKVSGALKFGMICQAVKVGSSYDMKVFVPAFSEMKLKDKFEIMKDFKKTAKSNTPIKLDILNTLKIIELYLQKSTKKERRKLKEHLLGLHAVYQKDLGQNKAVVNIGFLEIPDFIDLEDKEDWLEIIKDQKKLMNGITEQGDAIIGLLAYRQFLNASNINEYFKFHYWYAPYLMSELSNKKQSYISTNKVETLDKIFNHINSSEMKFKEIIENEGFQKVAAAIRKSTVSLQYTPKDQRKFDVQYGLAQKLQNKSKSKDDLIAFISEFIAKYNSDTARKNELFNSKKGLEGENIHFLRQRVEEKHLAAFYELADQVDAKVLGAMLAAYGFALNKKENPNNSNN